MDNLTLGPVQVFSHDVTELNNALRELSERIDALKGLRGRSLIFDRVRVDDAEETKDALNQIPGKAALPTTIAYEDEANTFTQSQSFQAVGFYGASPPTQASASANLTDNSGGTANDTVQALTDPADTPASADALRDDLVANLIPELRNNCADLTAKVNKALTVLRTLGLMAT